MTKCIEWQGYIGANGYGQVGRTEGAHRAVYRHCKGDIPKGMVVMHLCDNPTCVNPNHLQLGTPGDNMRDMVEKGRNVGSSDTTVHLFIHKDGRGFVGQRRHLCHEHKVDKSNLSRHIAGHRRFGHTGGWVYHGPA